jgi:hypothetical protein
LLVCGVGFVSLLGVGVDFSVVGFERPCGVGAATELGVAFALSVVGAALKSCSFSGIVWISFI